MKLNTKQFEQFILEADLLTQEYNGMTLGEIYMKVLEEHFSVIYKEVHDTKLNVYIHRENIPLLFRYLFSDER